MSDSRLPWDGRRAAQPPASDADPSADKTRVEGAGPFEAQLLTQGSIKRGLRGGKEVLDAARASYLKTEWSGPRDRRPRQGQLTKTKV
ncbi:MAG: hypothetical protein JWO33_2435 [Caulobacteraceae bacterium]|nr:hypothetical protein [Caulobacteraceae bacterium]